MRLAKTGNFPFLRENNHFWRKNDRTNGNIKFADVTPEFNNFCNAQMLSRFLERYYQRFLFIWINKFMHLWRRLRRCAITLSVETATLLAVRTFSFSSHHTICKRIILRCWKCDVFSLEKCSGAQLETCRSLVCGARYCIHFFLSCCSLILCWTLVIAALHRLQHTTAKYKFACIIFSYNKRTEWKWPKGNWNTSDS